jgi:hypothetical protein
MSGYPTNRDLAPGAVIRALAIKICPLWLTEGLRQIEYHDKLRVSDKSATRLSFACPEAVIDMEIRQPTPSNFSPP